MKPILPMLSAFDKSVGTTISFTWQGSQPFKNRLIIKDATTLETIYDITQTTMLLRHTISSENSLVNGNAYTVQVQVYDIDDTPSELSDSVLVRCFTTPTFEINMTNNDVVRNSFISPTLTYYQTEGELLSEYIISLYDVNHNVLRSSNTMYSADESYSFSGLSDSTQYYVRAQGTTRYGMALDTGYISFTVQYIIPQAQAIVNLTNNYHEGTIAISSGIKPVSHDSNTDDSDIIGGVIDLTNGKYVDYDGGFTLSGDFSLAIKLSEAKSGANLVTLSNSSENVCVRVVKNKDDDNYACWLIAESIVGRYILKTDDFALTTNQEYEVWITRKNNLYSIKINK